MIQGNNGARRSWLSASVIGLASASLLSDIGHEMATAAMPMFLGTLGLGATALGVIEGIADFLNGLSKLWGGWLGQRLRNKKPVTALGYLITALCTAAMARARGIWSLLVLRTAAWIGRGYRGPLRDFMMADAVPPTHYGRAFGLERAGDMVGAGAAPLIAALLLGFGFGLRQVLVWSFAPGLLAALSVLLFVREKPRSAEAPAALREMHACLPEGFGPLLAAILVFGMGDFSRTFLIFAAAGGLRSGGSLRAGALSLSVPVLLYVLHNAVSAVTTIPAGRAGDRWSKRSVLAIGYGLGALCNLLLWAGPTSLARFSLIFAVSGVYIAIEETVEKAFVSELIPRPVRSYGLGVLATANAAGDMLSSLYVGLLWDWAGAGWAFAVATAFSFAGFLLLLAIRPRGAADA
jgi:MFS family permease